MKDYEVLVSGFDTVEIGSYDPTIWSPEEVVARDGAYEVEEPRSEEVSGDIVRIVEEARKEAKEGGAEFYNGPLIRLQDRKVENGVLELDFQNTNYFSHVGTRERPELGKEDRADPLSVGTVLRTTDDFYILGEKSGNVEFGEGEYQLPGAGFIEDPEKQYQRSLNAQPSSPIHRELEEEVNLTPDQLTRPQPETLVGAVHRQPMLVYDTQTVLDSEEVTDEWLKIEEDDREFSELMFVPEDEVDALLEGEAEVKVSDEDGVSAERYDGSLRPHAQGALEALN